MKILAVAINTFREMIRDKILYIALFFTLLTILMGLALSSLGPGTSSRILKDFGFAGVSLLGIFLAIVTGVSLLFKELDKRTVLVVLSKPISRRGFVLGKFAGVLVTICLVELLMFAFFLIVLALFGVPIEAVYIQTFIMILFELSVVIGLALLFSSFTTPVLSGMFTLGFWVAGHLHEEFAAFVNVTENPFLKVLGSALRWLTPDLGAFDIKSRATYDLPTSWGLVGDGLLYCLLYTAILLLLSVMFFQKRDFK